jgi:hypothetical protein
MTTEIHIHDLARKFLSEESVSARCLAVYEFCDWLAENYIPESVPICAPELHAMYDENGDMYCRHCGKNLNHEVQP